MTIKWTCYPPTYIKWDYLSPYTSDSVWLTKYFSQPASGKGPEPEKYPLDGVDISLVSDETLTELFDTAPIIHNYQGTRIVRISQTLIIKGGINSRPCEANILDLIAKAAEREEIPSIPVPKVYRVLNIETEGVFFGARCLIVMDFVKGRTVEDCWEDLSQIERKDVVSEVASIINNLHSIPLPKGKDLVPGPVGCQDCIARGRFLPDAGAGPFSSTEELQAWYNRRLEITQHFHQAPPDALPFVFNKYAVTHYDVAPRNLILDSDSKVWLIDWGDAGIYPEGFDFAALNGRKDQAEEFTEMLFKMIPRYEDLSYQMLLIAYGLTTAQWIDSRWIKE